MAPTLPLTLQYSVTAHLEGVWIFPADGLFKEKEGLKKFDSAMDTGFLPLHRPIQFSTSGFPNRFNLILSQEIMQTE